MLFALPSIHPIDFFVALPADSVGSQGVTITPKKPSLRISDYLID
jgi:hypothetical protein